MLSLLFWLEIVVSLLLIICISFALIFHLMTFIEERVELTTKCTKALVMFNLVIGILLLFANYGYIVALSTIITNAIWLNLLTHNFPFVGIFDLNIISGFIFTVISHCAWLFALLDIETSGFFAYSLYMTLVWAIPLIIVSSLFTIDETVDRSAQQPKSIWHSILSSKIQWIKSKLPHTGDKLD